MRRLRHLALIMALVFLGSCTKAINYTDPQGPRYTGQYADPAAAPATGEIRLVTFNVKFAVEIDRAITLLRTDPALAGADVLLLQEMDEPGVRRIAQALRRDYVYYPATVHPSSGRDFGNAILSRWPITGDRKVLLPHLGRITGTMRIAVAGTILIRGEPVRFYSVHLATPVALGPGDRGDQVRALLDDARQGSSRVIIAGDLNSHELGEAIEGAGFLWPTKDLRPTAGLFHVDHIFLRGFQLRESRSAGVVRNNLDASDHYPVWARVVMD
jgi:endonuclease/exonuclease/phosphatase family metal-dependent hydrolase